ncbi:MAG: hypothetical protein HQL89_17500, partial [Magnetococcales bacterium]|nr:hypothetical protein [Magnetococcales bacterium]
MDALLDSANESAKLVRTVFLFFMLISLYISILVGSTTHKQLFLASAVPLPFMQVSLPVVGIYIVAPWIYFFLHFNLLQLLFVHSEKLHSLKKVACDDWEKKKTLLYPIFFFQLADQYAPKQFNPIHLHHFCLHHHGCSPPCAVVVDSGSILALSQRNHCKRRTNPRVPIVFSICDP